MAALAQLNWWPVIYQLYCGNRTALWGYMGSNYVGGIGVIIIQQKFQKKSSSKLAKKFMDSLASAVGMLNLVLQQALAAVEFFFK